MPTAIVTGSSRGIGAAIARRFARDGYDIAVNYHASENAADATAAAVRDAGRESIVVGADVSDADAAARLVETAVAELGGIDHLVNNAGIDQHVHTENLDPEEFDHVMDVNVNSVFNCTKAALPHLRESEVTPSPSVLNVSSISAHTGAAVECHYAGSKGAMLSLTRSHARDFAPEIRVNAVAPGQVETDMTSDRSVAEKADELSRIPIGYFGQPEDVADAAAFLRDARFITGETLNVNGGERMD